MSEPFTLVLPKVDTGLQAAEAEIPPPPKNELEVLPQLGATEQGRKQLVCKDMLPPAKLAEATAEAAKVYPAMYKNPQAILTYGLNAMDGVNRVIDQMLQDGNPLQIEEVRLVMRELSKSMRGVKGKYDLSDPKVKSDYDRWIKGKGGNFMHRARDFLADLRADLTTIESQFARASKAVDNQQARQMQTVGYYDTLLLQNVQEIKDLTVKIAVMEMIAEQARRDAAAIPKDDPSLGDENEVKRRRLADLASSLDIKIAEFKGRYFVATATTPRIQMSRQLAVGMTLKLSGAKYVTLPTMKATIAQWREQAATLKAAEFTNELDEAFNATLQGFAEATKASTSIIAGAINQPSLKPDSVTALGEAVIQMADDMADAMEAGIEARRELEERMVETQEAMNAGGERLTAAVIDRVLARSSEPLKVASTVVR